MHIHIISRQDAQKAGLRHYYTGEFCKNGHDSQRLTGARDCVICHKMASAKYRLTNPEMVMASQRLSYKKNKEKNKESQSKQNKLLYQKNKEKILLAHKKWKLENTERVAAANRLWQLTNPEKTRQYGRTRRAVKKLADGSHSAADIEDIKRLQKNKCAGCRQKIDGNSYEVDHIIPLILGGGDDRSNLQIMCMPCNRSKGGRPPEQFYQRKGFLI